MKHFLPWGYPHAIKSSLIFSSLNFYIFILSYEKYLGKKTLSPYVQDLYKRLTGKTKTIIWRMSPIVLALVTAMVLMSNAAPMTYYGRPNYGRGVYGRVMLHAGSQLGMSYNRYKVRFEFWTLLLQDIAQLSKSQSNLNCLDWLFPCTPHSTDRNIFDPKFGT